MREYVIERTSEMKREWWTGAEWSEDETAARWYDREPNAEKETQDESAHVVRYEAGRTLFGPQSSGLLCRRGILYSPHILEAARTLAPCAGRGREPRRRQERP